MFTSTTVCHISAVIKLEVYTVDWVHWVCLCLLVGMNSAVRSVVRMGTYIGCRVFLIKEVW